MTPSRPQRLAGAAAESAPATSPPEPAETLLLDLGRGGIDVSILRGGRRVVHSMQAPPELLPFLPGAPDGTGGAREKLRKYFLAHGNDRPVVVRNGRRETPVDWQGYSPRETCAETDILEGDTLRLRHVLIPRPGSGNGPLIREGFWFDLRAGSFGLLPRDGGWRAWHRIRRHLSLRDVRPVSEETEGRSAIYRLRDIEAHGIPLGDDPDSRGKEIRFLVHGLPVPLEPAVPSFALSIHRPPAPRSPWLVRGSVVVDGHRFPLSGELCRTLHPAAAPSAVRRAGGADEWVGSVFEALDPQERGTAAGRAADAPRTALEAADRIRGEESLAFPAGARWLSFAVDRKRQARLLEIPFRLFGGGIFPPSGKAGEMAVPAREIAGKLHALLAEAGASGIVLSFDDHEVATAGLEVSVRADSGPSDWFEVRPEISIDGVSLDEEAWEDTLLRDGYILRGDRVLLLEPGMRDLLAAVAASMGRGKRQERGRLVRIPRLAILDLLDLRRRGVRVVLPERERTILDRLAGFEEIPETRIPEGLRTKLRRYQAEGFGWLAFLYENRFGACLADDMGLGKTVQAIAFLAAIREGIVPSRAPGSPSLVVMPPSLLFNWESEIQRFYPGLKVVSYRGKGRTPEFGDADLVLTTYDIVRRDIETLSKRQFDVVVFDEAQAVKNLFAKSTGAARRLRRSFSVALTGTPVENHLGEYFSILDLVVPGILGDYDDVRRRLRKEDPVFLDAVRRRSRPFVLRRAKESILPELPSKVESDLFLELTDRQKTLYRKAAEAAREEVERAYKTRTEGRARVIALTAILRLRQLCLSPELLFPARRESAPKIDFLMTRLAELREEGHSVLVFSQFTTYLDLVERAMGEQGIGAMRLDGATPVPERKRRVEAFQGGADPSVFLLSLKAGGKGLNLVKASYVILLDPWWNPAVERQAADRAHRIGQLRKVSVLRLLMRHTVEEKMVALSARKAGLYRALLGAPGAGGGAPLSREDFAFLLG